MSEQNEKQKGATTTSPPMPPLPVIQKGKVINTTSSKQKLINKTLKEKRVFNEVSKKKAADAVPKYHPKSYESKMIELMLHTQTRIEGLKKEISALGMTIIFGNIGICTVLYHLLKN